MTGLQLARAFWEAEAGTLMEGVPASVRDRAAFGLVGAGSECLGFDDALSRDHDFGPGFCVWLPADAHAVWGVRLQERYEGLPTSFMGVERLRTPLSGKRVGVFEIGDFYQGFLGLPRAPRTTREWLAVPEQLLAAATSGEVFLDRAGEFTAVRDELLGFYPVEVVRKKVAADCASMARAGQYNLARCLKRGDLVAAHAARDEFLRSLMAVLHLLRRTYQPFYKWAWRSLVERAGVGDALCGLVRRLAAAPVAKTDLACVELACSLVRRALNELGWARTQDDFLLEAAREVQEGLTDDYLRGLPLGMGGVR